MVRKKKEKKSKKKRKTSSEQIFALKSIHEWVSLDYPPLPPSDDDFQVPKIHNLSEPLVFDLHSHSTCSDGFLSPSALVQRAQRNGDICMWLRH